MIQNKSVCPIKGNGAERGIIMLDKNIHVEAPSPISAARAAFPNWGEKIESMLRIPSDRYVIYAANGGDVTITVWENSLNSDGTRHYLCHAHCW